MYLREEKEQEGKDVPDVGLEKEQEGKDVPDVGVQKEEEGKDVGKWHHKDRNNNPKDKKKFC